MMLEDVGMHFAVPASIALSFWQCNAAPLRERWGYRYRYTRRMYRPRYGNPPSPLPACVRGINSQVLLCIIAGRECDGVVACGLRLDTTAIACLI